MSIFEESKQYRPFKYGWAVEAERVQFLDTFWHEGQIELQDDLIQYHSKNGLQTENCSHEFNKEVFDTLSLFFTQLDMSVAEGYVQLLPYTKNNEVKGLFIQQAAKEIRHQRAYALAGETFGFTDADWGTFREFVELTDKMELINEGDGDLSIPFNYAKKLTRLLLSEGIGLFAAFAGLLNFKRFGKFIGFNDVNSWSLLDEGLHVENNIRVLQDVIKELSPKDQTSLIAYTKELVKEFVATEHSVVDLITAKGELEGIATQDFKDYLTYLGNLRLFQIGYVGSLEVGDNPMKWMDTILSAEKHGAFFEKRVTDYSHTELPGEIDYSKYLSLKEGLVLT